MKFKNYIFDCGNVLFSFSHQFLLETLIPDSNDWELFREIVFNNWEVQDMYVDSEDYCKDCISKLPERLHYAAEQIILHWDLYFTPFEDMKELIKRLKETGHNLYLLSNMPSMFCNDHSRLPTLNYFDDLLFSYEIKLIKPNREIFEFCVEKHNLNVEDCIFIDDLKANCEASEKVGIKSYLFDKTKRDEFISFVKDIEEL